MRFTLPRSHPVKTSVANHSLQVLPSLDGNAASLIPFPRRARWSVGAPVSAIVMASATCGQKAVAEAERSGDVPGCTLENANG